MSWLQDRILHCLPTARHPTVDLGRQVCQVFLPLAAHDVDASRRGLAQGRGVIITECVREVKVDVAIEEPGRRTFAQGLEALVRATQGRHEFLLLVVNTKFIARGRRELDLFHEHVRGNNLGDS
jgi:hypothetical protein